MIEIITGVIFNSTVREFEYAFPIFGYLNDADVEGSTAPVKHEDSLIAGRGKFAIRVIEVTDHRGKWFVQKSLQLHASTFDCSPDVFPLFAAKRDRHGN